MKNKDNAEIERQDNILQEPKRHKYTFKFDIYEPVQAFTLIWQPVWPHLGVLQNSPKIGKTVYLYAYQGTWV